MSTKICFDVFTLQRGLAEQGPFTRKQNWTSQITIQQKNVYTILIHYNVTTNSIGCEAITMPSMRSVHPLYVQLKASLLERIESGEWPSGQMIPTEQELTTLHNVSRTTVRQAIRDLVDAGYLIRQQGRGTFVQRKVHTQSTHLYGFMEELEQANQPISIREFQATVIPVSERIASLLRITPRQNVLFVSRVICTDGEPLFYDESYLPEDLLARIRTQGATRSLYKLLEAEGISIASGEQTVTAALAGPLRATRLACRADDPVLHVERITEDGAGRPVEYSSVSYRADRYAFAVKLTRQETI